MRNNKHDIAVVGLACKFPGADSVESYWDLLLNKENAVDEVPAERWSIDEHYSSDVNDLNKTYSKWGGFLKDIEKFDPEFFGITPREAETLDPQQRLLLEVAWESLESAGIKPKCVAGSKTGVFVGACKSEYWELHKQSTLGFNSASVTGADLGILPNRLSYVFDFKGPSIVIDTLCSSSLVSVHYACQSLRSNECNMALAGGVNLLLLPDATVALSQSQALSPSGACRTFDESADGYVRGEGCGLVVLKRMQDALQEGDNILAVIRGSAVNQDGKSNGISAPNRFSQVSLLKSAHGDAGVDAREISFIECHGTGTPLGDPIEINAIRDAFTESFKAGGEITLGAVKANIGHLEAAAGIAGLIKLVLMLKHQVVPGQPHYHNVNPRINLDGIKICSAAEKWQSHEPRIAGISAFSFGGVNAHLVLAEAKPKRYDFVENSGDGAPLVLSSHSEQSLKKLCSSYAEVIEQQGCSAAQVALGISRWRQNDFTYRVACSGENESQWASDLKAYSKGQTPSQNFHTRDTFVKKNKVAVMFTGQGSQRALMGRKLYEAYPVFKQSLDQCAAILKNYDIDLMDIVLSEDEGLIQNTAYTQPLIFAYEYALYRLSESFGIEANVLLGHSVGEYVAACIAGVFSLEDALKLISARGRLMTELCQPGAMTAVFAPSADIESILECTSIQYDVAALNGRALTVLSGSAPDLDDAEAILQIQGIKSKRLLVSHAFHSRMMDPMLPAFKAVLDQVTFNKPSTPIVSNLDGKLADSQLMTVEYWLEHIRKPVDFLSGMETIGQSGVTALVELGPGTVLTGLAKQCQLPESVTIIPSIKGPATEKADFKNFLANAYINGINIQAPGDYQLTIKPTDLPSVAFNKKKYWLADSSGIDQSALNHQTPNLHPYLGEKIDIAGSNEVLFNQRLDQWSHHYLNDHCVDDVPVFPAAGYVDAFVAAIGQIERSSFRLVDIEFLKPLLLDQGVKLQTRISNEERIELWANTHDGDWNKYAQAYYKPGGEVRPSLAKPSTSHDVDVSRHYQWLASIGLNYGKQFRGLSLAQTGDGMAVGVVSLPAEVSVSDKHCIHPTLLDSAMHLVTIVIRDKFDLDIRLVPESFEEIYSSDSLTGYSDYTVITQLKDVDRGRLQVIADIEIFDANNNCVVACRGLKAVSIAALSATKLPIYTPNWQREDLDSEATEDEFCLIVVESQEEDIARQILSANGGCGSILVLDECSTGAESYSLNDSQLKEIEEFSNNLLNNKNVLYLAPSTDSGDMLARETVAVGKAFTFVKTLTQYVTSFSILPIKVVTFKNHQVQADDKVSALGASIQGIFGSFANEMHNIQSVIVDINTDLSEIDAIRLLSEETIDSPRVIAYRNNQRYVRQLLRSESIGRSEFIPSKSGCYLIVGGAGGIGQLLSDELAKSGSTNIVWLGRSAFDAGKEQALAVLEDLGTQAMYVQADVQDAVSLKTALSSVTEKFGSVKGVVHAAAVLNDGFLQTMKFSEFERAWAPKVRGIINLYNAVKGQPLQFFSIYSSAASYGFNRGQANYVAGGCFVDSYCQQLRGSGIPASTINWGFWGGLGVSNVEGLQELMKGQGVEPITEREGRDILVSLLIPNAQQVMPINASDELLAKWGLPIAESSTASQVSEINDELKQALLTVGNSSIDHGCSVILEFLKVEVASVMKGTIESIDTPANPFIHLSLSSIGFDSLMIMDLRARIQRHLEVSLSTEDIFKSKDMSEIAEAIYNLMLLNSLSGGEQEEEESDMETFVI